MKGKFRAVLFILLFVLIAAAVFTVLTGLDNRLNLTGTAPTPELVVNAPTPMPTVQAAPVTTPFAAPVSTPVPTPVVTPAATMPPSVTLSPVVTAPPVSTPLPTTVPTTAPVPMTLSSGSFRSDTGTALNIVADWSTQSIDQNRVQVTVSVSALSFALHTQTLPNAVNIALDGQYVSLEAPEINYDGGEQMVTPLASRSFTVELPVNSSRALSLQVEWQFNGVYGGTELPVIECGGTISIAR